MERSDVIILQGKFLCYKNDAILTNYKLHLGLGVSVGKYLKEVNWTQDHNARGKEVETNWRKGKHYAFCTGHGRKRVPLKVNTLKNASL